MTISKRHLTPLEERFIKSGLDGLDDREIIESLLNLCYPRGEHKELAATCIERFRNLREFLTATPQELTQVGLNSRAIAHIIFVRELPAALLKQQLIKRSIYKSSKEVFEYLNYSMRDLRVEVFKVIYLNRRGQIIDTVTLFEGTTDGIPIRPREIVESAIKYNVGALIFVHNHPSGDPSPSRSDKQLTRDLVCIGNILQLKVLDHIIIGGNTYYSFADGGLIQKYEDNFLNMKIKAVLDSRGQKYGKH